MIPSERDRKLHAILTCVWVAFAPVAMFTSLRSSIQLLVGISIYANIAGHWAAYQASRAEDEQ